MQHLSRDLDRHRFADSAVFGIPHHRMPKMRHRRTDLVQEARLQANVEERRVRKDLDRSDDLATGMAALFDFDVCGIVTLYR